MPPLVKISEAFSLAIHALAYIASDARRADCAAVAEIAGALHVSESHLAKVLQTMAKGKLLDSVRGAKGGFRLAVDPARVTLWDVWTTLHGETSVRDCLLDKPICRPGHCLLCPLVKGLDGMMREHLKKTRLSAFQRAELVG